jgi:hypothetical protein
VELGTPRGLTGRLPTAAGCGARRDDYGKTTALDSRPSLRGESGFGWDRGRDGADRAGAGSRRPLTRIKPWRVPLFKARPEESATTRRQIKDAPEGIKAAEARVQPTISAFISSAMLWPTRERTTARRVRPSLPWFAEPIMRRLVAERMRGKFWKLATRMKTAEEGVRAYLTFPRQHRAKLTRRL